MAPANLVVLALQLFKFAALCKQFSLSIHQLPANKTIFLFLCPPPTGAVEALCFRVVHQRVCLSVRVCVLLACYLTIQWTEFHQTLVDDGSWGDRWIDWVLKVKGHGQGHSKDKNLRRPHQCFGVEVSSSLLLFTELERKITNRETKSREYRPSVKRKDSEGQWNNQDLILPCSPSWHNPVYCIHMACKYNFWKVVTRRL